MVFVIKLVLSDFLIKQKPNNQVLIRKSPKKSPEIIRFSDNLYQKGKITIR